MSEPKNTAGAELDKSDDQPDDAILVVDGYEMDEEYRSIYRPGAFIQDANGLFHQLPRFFLELPSSDFASKLRLTPHFAIEEFVRVDLRETQLLRAFPRYVPVAVRVMAHYLERFRDLCGETVNISVNGGYRSPRHSRPDAGDPHRWGVAVDIYRVGSTLINNKDSHEHFARHARQLGEEVNVGAWSEEDGSISDHLHFDLGFMVMTPAYADEHPRVAEIIQKESERRQQTDEDRRRS